MHDLKPAAKEPSAEPSLQRSEQPSGPEQQGFAGVAGFAQKVLTLQRQPAPAQDAPAPAGQPSKAPEAPDPYRMTEENILKTVEALYGASAADLVRSGRGEEGAGVQINRSSTSGSRRCTSLAKGRKKPSTFPLAWTRDTRRRPATDSASAA